MFLLTPFPLPAQSDQTVRCFVRINCCVVKEGGPRRLVRYCPPFQLFLFACTGSHFWLMPSVPLSSLFLHLWTNFFFWTEPISGEQKIDILHCVMVFRLRGTMVKPYDQVFTLGKPPMYITMYAENWCPIPEGEYVTGAFVIPTIPW